MPGTPKAGRTFADAGVPQQRVNVVGALDYATGQLWHAVQMQSIGREAVVERIDRIAQRAQRKLDDWLINHRLLLMHLPPYCPELNPIEIVWKQVKYHWRRFAT